MSNKEKKNDFGCHLFKTEVVSEILSQIDERIDILEKNGDVTYIEGINIIEMWRNLYSEIETLWLKDNSQPIITLNKVQELKLRFLSDFVAQFFLYNGNETDNDFLKNVSDFFKSINEKYEGVTTIDVWKELKSHLSV